VFFFFFFLSCVISTNLMIHGVKNTTSVLRKAQRTYQKKHPKVGPAESISVESKTPPAYHQNPSHSLKHEVYSKVFPAREVHIQTHHLLAVRAIQPPTPGPRAMPLMVMVMMSMRVLATRLTTSVARIESPHRTTVLLLSLLVFLLLLVLLMLILQHIGTNSSNHTSDDCAKHSATDFVS